MGKLLLRRSNTALGILKLLFRFLNELLETQWTKYLDVIENWQLVWLTELIFSLFTTYPVKNKKLQYWRKITLSTFSLLLDYSSLHKNANLPLQFFLPFPIFSVDTISVHDYPRSYIPNSCSCRIFIFADVVVVKLALLVPK